MNTIILFVMILAVFYWGQLKLHRDRAMHAFRHIPDPGNRELFAESDKRFIRWTVVCLVMLLGTVTWFLIKDAARVVH